MLRSAAVVALVAALTLVLAPGSAQPATGDVTVAAVKRAFTRATGLPLVVFRDASTADVTSLRSRPHYTPHRFGEFQIFVFRPDRAAAMRRVFTGGIQPDAKGIYWVPDRTGGWIAVTLHARNLAVAWFPLPSGHYVDARWRNLQAVARRLR